MKAEPSEVQGACGVRWPEDRPSRRGCWVLLIGLALGMALGLGYAWGLNPVQFYDTEPVDLRPEHKETWLLLVASAYRQEGDLDRATARLAGLKDPRVGRTLAAFTERYIEAGKPAVQVRALASLADALGARTDNMLIYLATPEPTSFFTATPEPFTPTATPAPATPTPVPATATATPTGTPTGTPTPYPTATRYPTPTGPPPYTLESRQRLCEAGQGSPRVEIFVQTREGAGLAGVELWITWTGGADRFLTGLKPEVGLGYADFDLQPDVVYALAVGEPMAWLTGDLSATRCRPGDENSPLSSWRLTIVANSEAFTPTPAPTAPSPTPVQITPSSTPRPAVP
jgi:hypothetical protein